MPQLGFPIVYCVPPERQMLTKKHDKSEVRGSAFHPELTDFAGLVVRVCDVGRYDIVIFPPNRAPATVNDVPEEELEDPSETAFESAQNSADRKKA
jgi:hypothetical protein